MEDIRQAQHFGTKTSSKGRNAICSKYIHNIHQCNTDDSGQTMGEELEHVQISSCSKHIDLFAAKIVNYTFI